MSAPIKSSPRPDNIEQAIEETIESIDFKDPKSELHTIIDKIHTLSTQPHTKRGLKIIDKKAQELQADLARLSDRFSAFSKVITQSNTPNCHQCSKGCSNDIEDLVLCEKS